MLTRYGNLVIDLDVVANDIVAIIAPQDYYDGQLVIRPKASPTIQIRIDQPSFDAIAKALVVRER